MYPEARELLERALKDSPKDLATLNNLAVLLEDCIKDADEAETIYRYAPRTCVSRIHVWMTLL
jgi:tetratricopeptide (TPR) repeat protein